MPGSRGLTKSRFVFHHRERPALHGRGMFHAGRPALSLAFLLAAAPAQGGVQTLQEKIAQTNWAEVRGVNFVPSYASNTYEIWRNYDHEIVDRDLRMASDVGYKSVRLWLNYAAYEELGPGMVDRVEDSSVPKLKFRSLRTFTSLYTP